MREGFPRNAAMDWSNAGFSSVAAMEFKPALEDLTLGKTTAEKHGAMKPLIYAENDLASLYLQMGDPDHALQIAREGLGGPAGHADAGMRSTLLQQEAQALAMLHRLPEAEPIYREALDGLMNAGSLDAAARVWAGLGDYYIDAQRYDDAERALSESLRLVRTHHLKASAGVLMQLARLRARQGNPAAAEYLFQDAIDAHETMTPLWLIYYERGAARLEAGRNREALEDFRESRRLAVRMRANIVPADQDRVTLENRVSRIFEGLVDAGNRLALPTQDRSILDETFNAAEQDRLWSLRALIPSQNDWRSHLPARYWELLARYQVAERSLAAGTSVVMEKQAADLQLELQQAEAAAGAESDATTELSPESPLEHARKVLAPDSVLLSFSIGDQGSWLWLVDRAQIHVYALPGRERIEREVGDFTQRLRSGGDSSAAGSRLFRTLFGEVPSAFLKRTRWLIEPDGPLYELPFAALSTPKGLLIEHAAVQSVPGALLMEQGALDRRGSFTGIGDPVLNEADRRYHGTHVANVIALPRLPNTATELKQCSLTWGTNARLLTGSDAGLGAVESAISSQSPAIIHFATHVIPAPDRFSSGLIALSLDARGAMGLMGPNEITSLRVPGSLVVMNSCRSAQGATLAGSGLMGLTRAWIGAGASAVISSQWDVPDDASQFLMVKFYSALRNSRDGNPATALREAQLAALHSGGPASQPSRWAGYFLLSRI
jgi:CHAT domain-containing protein